ncbi:MAG: OmpA family protein [Actinomycetales bacterium]|nr:OmpA family protein [Actinomycetales bacterium]
MPTQRAFRGAVACICIAGLLLIAPGAVTGPAQAADPAGVARMQACTPTSAGFVSLEAAPEVTGSIPISAGMHRLWDLGVTWKDVNPAPGSFTWTALDAQVAKAEASGAKAFLVLGMTPAWAATNPSAGDPRWGAGTASPPRDINDWKAYVTAVVDRYGSRIAGYETWNEANLSTFWTGTPDQMADLTAAAYQIIKAKQPDAIVTLPSVTLRLRPSMRRFVMPFLAALGSRGNPFDAFAIHSYPAGNLGPADRVNDIVYWQSTVVDQVGASSPVLDRLVFDTEVNYGLAGPGPTPGRAYSDAEGAALIQQTYLDSRSLGIDATFWYLYTAAPYSLLGVQLWQGSPAALDAWQALRRVFPTGTPCAAAGAPDPFEVDRKLAATAVSLPAEAGKSSVLEDGAPAPGIGPPVIAGPRLSLGGPGWTLAAQAPTVRTSAPFGATAGSTIAVTGTGYAPGSTVYAWLLAPTAFLGSTTADANGAFSINVTVPADTAAGTHVLQVNGLMPGGKVRSASIAFQLFAAASSPASATVTFALGKKKLDSKARGALRDLVAGVPTTATTTTTVTGFVAKAGPRKKAQALARTRAQKVVDYLRKAGLRGTITMTKPSTAAKKAASRISVTIAWR